MKKFFSLLMITGLVCLQTMAADVTASVVAATTGLHNGKISLTLSGGIAPYTFSWTGPGGYSSGKQNIDSLAPGTYCVEVSDQYCGIARLCVEIPEVPNGIHTPILDDMALVYPNPFYNMIHIHLASASKETIQIQLLNALGQVVYTATQSAGNDFDLQLPEYLPDGNYLLRLQNSSGRTWQKKLNRFEP